MPSWAKSCLLLVLLACSVAPLARAATSSDPNEELDARIAGLIQQLGDNEYEVRERAQQGLIKLGSEAFDALAQAENSDDIEIATQARYLVHLIRSDWTHDTDAAEVKSILKDYDQKGDDERGELIKELAQLPPEDGLEPLCRLVRFERSPVLSKQAAVAVFNQDAPADKADWDTRAATIRKELSRSTRPGADWLRAYVLAHENPEQGLAQWAKLTDAELETLREQPTQSHNRLVIALLRRKVELLDAAHRADEALAVLRHIVEIEPGDPREPQTLTDLVDWLVTRAAWPIVDEVATKFASNFEADAMLLYTLAKARLEEGKKDLAEQTAEKALKLNPDKAEEHLQIALRLEERGLVDWSDREYRHVIGLGPPTSKDVLWAQFKLSESLHDREKDQEAGDVLKGLVDAMDHNPKVIQMLQSIGNVPESVRSRMNFFYASHFAAVGDRAQQIKHLDTAIGLDPSDVDVLISLYHLPDQEPQRHAKTVELIGKAIDELRKMIEEDVDEQNAAGHAQLATAYNQMAWLVANTEGDFDEAIHWSQRSIFLARSHRALRKRVGGYLDTLGRCYYANRDYENAVKYQSEAVKLEPHLQQISRQLAVFRKALDDKKVDDKKTDEKKAAAN